MRIDPVEELCVGLAVVEGWRGEEARKKGRLMAWRIRQALGGDQHHAD